MGGITLKSVSVGVTFILPPVLTVLFSPDIGARFRESVTGRINDE